MSAADRLALLRQAIQDDSGEWTTCRVRQLYRSHAYDAPKRRTARTDLAFLARQGLLVHDGTDSGRHCYWPTGITTETSRVHGQGGGRS